MWNLKDIYLTTVNSVRQNHCPNVFWNLWTKCFMFQQGNTIIVSSELIGTYIFKSYSSDYIYPFKFIFSQWYTNQSPGKHPTTHRHKFVYGTYQTHKRDTQKRCLCKLILWLLIDIHTIVVKILIAEIVGSLGAKTSKKGISHSRYYKAE